MSFCLKIFKPSAGSAKFLQETVLKSSDAWVRVGLGVGRRKKTPQTKRRARKKVFVNRRKEKEFSLAI